jgi:hypothetical protein
MAILVPVRQLHLLPHPNQLEEKQPVLYLPQQTIAEKLPSNKTAIRLFLGDLTNVSGVDAESPSEIRKKPRVLVVLVVKVY